MRHALFILWCVFILGVPDSSSLALSLANEGSPKQQSQDASQVKDSYICPMHPDVKSDKPGNCPKCGMALVSSDSQEKEGTQESTRLSPAERIRAAKRMLQAAKSELVRQGTYNCCIEDPCTQCALDHQSCPCYDDLKKGKTVCPECYGGWQRGEGRDKNRKASEVKTKFSGHKH